MTVHLELKPETERILRERAEQRHLPVEDYLRTLVESALRSSVLPAGKPARTQKEMEEFLRGFSQFSDKIPNHPGKTWSRETLYEDHD